MRDLQAGANVRLLATSQVIPELTQYFQSYPWLEVRASEDDVRRFVTGITRLPSCIQRNEKPKKLENEVQNKIVVAVDSM